MTRFTILILFSLIFQLEMTGQVQSGTIPIAGGLAFSRTEGITDFRSESTGIFPSFGYFFNDNFGLIGGFSYSNLNLTLKNSPRENEIYNENRGGFLFFAGARQYFPFLSYRAFGQIDLINQNSTRKINDLDLTPVNIFTSKLSFGANAWLSENISLEGIVKYTFIKKRDYEDRFRFLQGPIEVLFDIKPYVNTGWTESSFASDVYLNLFAKNVGGTASFRHSLKGNERIVQGQQFDSPSLTFELRPKFGVFLFKGGLFGAQLGISLTENNLDNPISFAVNPYFRYYINVTDGWQIVPNIQYVYNYVEFRGDLVGNGSNTQTFQIIPGLGLHTFLTDGIGIFGNGTLGFKQEPNPSIPDLERSTLLRFELGLEYYLSGN